MSPVRIRTEPSGSRWPRALMLPARVDRPDIDKRVTADDVVEVVQVDRRVAMRGYEFNAFTEDWDRMAPRREEQSSVLVAGVVIGRPQRAARHDLRLRPFGREAFESCVGGDVAAWNPRAGDAHHRGLHEERGFEWRRVAPVGER